MSIKNPFVMDIFTKFDVGAIGYRTLGNTWRGRLANPVEVKGSVKWQALSQLLITVAPNDPMLPFLMDDGARMVVSYRGAVLISGMITVKSGGLMPTDNYVFTLTSDWRKLQSLLAFVNPFNNIVPTSLASTDTTQIGQAWLPQGTAVPPSGTTTGQLGSYLWPNGGNERVNYLQYPIADVPIPAFGGSPNWTTLEAAIKGIIVENWASRRGENVIVHADHGRGPTVSRISGAAQILLPSNIRFDTLESVVLQLQDLCIRAGIAPLGVAVYQGPHIDGANTTPDPSNTAPALQPENWWHVEVIVPKTWTVALTVASGVVVEGSWSISVPTGTRMVIGGPGDDVQRWIDDSGYITTTIDQFGDVVEQFRDASGVALTWGATPAAQQVAKFYDAIFGPNLANDQVYFEGQNGLTAGQEQVGTTATLAESIGFHFGGTDGVQLGDTVTIDGTLPGQPIGSGVQFTEQITEAQFSLTATEFSVTPIVGIITDDPDQNMANVVVSIARAAANQARKK